MESSKITSRDSLENVLAEKFGHFSLDQEIRAIAEHLRDEAISEIRNGGDMCEKKQKLIGSIEVVSGARSGEYFVVSKEEYGKNLEYGTRNSLESPWFIPAFVKVSGSIGTCLQGALNTSSPEDKAASRSQVNSGPAVICNGSRYNKPTQYKGVL